MMWTAQMMLPPPLPTHRGTWLGALPPEGYSQLAGSEAEDIESGKKAEEHSWISLFWGACLYVWPEDKWLQVRGGV